MSICSLVVYARPEKLSTVSEALTAMEGVEIHASSDQGKLVVSIDHPQRRYCSDAMMTMSTMDGVINTALIYEYFEEDDSERPLDSEPTPTEVTP
ncbi:MAG TPA: nitrate reductase formation protein NapD [Gammaproteobacteria bacterium]|nr:nitrate reductase formation protein NapD [Gammaproteobacteria bacterium]